jgi:D-sedoheptulose 7-phosphate isomerase
MLKFNLEAVNFYKKSFVKILDDVAVTGRRCKFNLDEGINASVSFIYEAHKSCRKIIFIGNGGSAAIASHQAADFIRTCGIKAFAPLDHSLLTCFANDCGYENVFVEPLKILADCGDVLVAISSSGKSPNIIKAVAAMREKNLKIITLSGFDPDNPLRKQGDINFYVPSDSYRYVESAHLFICNWLLDFTQKSIIIK